MMTQRNAQRSTLNAQRSRLQTSASLYLCVKKRQPPRRRAFTLIETALAMLAIGLGLLALFGLGRIGLQSAKETENDARCVQMADAIFETLRDCNARFVDEARTNQVEQSWHNFWSKTVDTANQIHFPPVANMSSSENLFLEFFKPGDEDKLASAYDKDAVSLSDWNPRYRLYLHDKYDSRVANGINFKQVTLFIYPDGDTFSSDYRIFHTTLSNTGGLQ